MTFNKLGLDARLVSRLDALGLTQPTPIQEQAISQALHGHDILGIAQTGIGKTAAFGIPLVVALSKHKKRPARLSTFVRRDALMEAGWATVPGANAPGRDIAQSCLASLDVDVIPERPETEAEEG